MAEGQLVANCHSRPWEPHKYVSKVEQDEKLQFLLSWVREYYTREGEMSLAAHRALFEAYAGPREVLRSLPQLDPPSAQLLAWLK